jgi:hypothetical protein
MGADGMKRKNAIIVQVQVQRGNVIMTMGDRVRDQMRDVLWCSSLSQKLCFRNPLKLLFLWWKCFFLLYEQNYKTDYQNIQN